MFYYRFFQPAKMLRNGQKLRFVLLGKFESGAVECGKVVQRAKRADKVVEDGHGHGYEMIGRNKAAIQELGTNGYTASTLNAICSNHGISKGLLYHNFTGKDGLYLACVSHCFSDVTEYLLKYNTVLSVDNRYGIEPCVSVKK